MSAEDAAAEEAVDFEAEAPEAAEDTVMKEAAAGDAAPTNDAAPAAANGTAAAKKVMPVEPEDPMSLPPQGSEVFIGGIPKSATEEQIREFAEQAGTVHSVKLTRDPNNKEQNRGFGFVRYCDKASADSAKETLHETELKGTKSKIRVSDSKAKHKLHVASIARIVTEEQLSDELNKIVKGLLTINLVLSKELPGQNRGFAFLTFYNHECAAAAKEIIAKSTFNPGGRALVVSYAEAKEQQQPEGPPPRPNKAVYVGGLPQGATTENLSELFAKYGEVDKVVIPAATKERPEQQFGFVHFKEQASANKAVTEAQAEKPELLEKALDVKAARPQEPRDGRQGAGPAGRGGGRSHPGRGGYPPQGGRGGRGMPRQQYSGYEQQGYDQGYGGYDEGYGGYDQGAYGVYGGPAPVAAAAGMTMVPMMLPSGQVGYVLQSADGSADYGSYGGADRSFGGRAPRGGGRGRGGGRRYMPY